MRCGFLLLTGLLVATPVSAQDRDTLVRNDRQTYGQEPGWVYNDLEQGIQIARASGKPMMVVFRCIPCEACQQFDDEVARRDPIVRDLLDQFVCVRIVQANDIDLTRFQFDFDQSFAVVLMNPDRTIYGRFGTRSERPEHEDISLPGLRKALEAALSMHANYRAVRPKLEAKQVRQSRYATPRDYPSLTGKYGTTIDYEGATARSCMHCHQVGEAMRLVFRAKGEPIPDEVLFTYPDPSRLGLKLDPKEMATVERVAPESPAARAGLQPGDAIETLDGQPLLSIADLQWVLHNAPDPARLDATIRRGGETRNVTLDLPAGWRRGNLSWRATSWDLRRMALGGMLLEELTEAERTAAGLPENALALRAKHVGEFGEHAVALRAGVRRGDILITFDGQTRRMTESDLLAYALQRKRPGDEVTVTVLRDGAPRTVRFRLQ